MAPNADDLVVGTVTLEDGTSEKEETSEPTGAAEYSVDQLINLRPPPHLKVDPKNNISVSAVTEAQAGPDDIDTPLPKTPLATVEDAGDAQDADHGAGAGESVTGENSTAEAPKKKKKKKSKSKAARGILPVSGFEGA